MDLLILWYIIIAIIVYAVIIWKLADGVDAAAMAISVPVLWPVFAGILLMSLPILFTRWLIVLKTGKGEVLPW